MPLRTTPPGLDALDIFEHLTASEKGTLAAALKTESLTRGDELMRQGDVADALYIVVSGRFSVHLAGRDAPIVEIGPGQPIGEIAFLTGERRTATVRAMRDSLVLRLDRVAFDALAETRPSIWRALTMTLAQRLAAQTATATAGARHTPRTITLVRAGGGTLSRGFVELLWRVLKRSRQACLVDADVLRGMLPLGCELDGPEATRALNTLESTHDCVMLVADDDLTPFSAKAIRHADLVLAIGEAGEAPEPNALERMTADFVAQDARRLVLVHPRRGRVTGTGRWLTPRKVALHHHVSLSDDADVQRLVRFIDGRAVGLVACGGGALCAAHVGLYKALEDGGIGFDIMGGTSAGAAMVAGFALGLPAGDIDDVVHEMFVVNAAMRRYTWPRYSLLDHTHFDTQLARFFGGRDIEDMWIPFFAVSTNLSSCRIECHRSGDLWRAVRASASIPVLLPPVYTDDGEMLVDGCLLDNVPIRTMHEFKSGPNLVISFRLPEMERFAVDYSALPSRGRLVASTLVPSWRRALPEAPGLVSVLMRSLMANRDGFMRHLKEDDLVWVPPLPATLGFLDWHRHAEVMAAAYVWATREVDRIKASCHPVTSAPPTRLRATLARAAE